MAVKHVCDLCGATIKPGQEIPVRVTITPPFSKQLRNLANQVAQVVDDKEICGLCGAAPLRVSLDQAECRPTITRNV